MRFIIRTYETRMLFPFKVKVLNIRREFKVFEPLSSANDRISVLKKLVKASTNRISNRIFPPVMTRDH